MCRFKKVQFTLEAVFSGEAFGPEARPAEAVRQVEAELIQKRNELQAFEAEYRRVRAGLQASDVKSSSCIL